THPALEDRVHEAALAAIELGEHFILPETVPADRRAADQHGRATLEARDQAHDMAGDTQPRRQDAPTLPARPQSVCDRLARPIDDRIDRRFAVDPVQTFP